jgi:hypothetical protein
MKMSIVKGWRSRSTTLAVLCLVLFSAALPARAASPDTGFSIQVTPSPLVVTAKPGQTTIADLKVRNGGTQTELLKVEPRTFSVENNSQEVKLNDTPPPGISSWIHISEPTFQVESGQWHTVHVTISPPKQSGFSFSFALVISRQKEQSPTERGRLIKGSVAVFTLINIDRAGATKRVQVTKFTVTKRVYEYLPASFEIEFKNSGNSIVQPYGNIFVQRTSSSNQPLSTLPVNSSGGYILPGVTRTLNVGWSDGFPVREPVIKDDGSTRNKLTWDWSNASNFRFGRYTAKLVAVYNDGTRDVPIEGEVTFWVIPWKLLLLLLVILALLGAGIWSIVKKSIMAARRVKSKAKNDK